MLQIVVPRTTLLPVILQLEVKRGIVVSLLVSQDKTVSELLSHISPEFA